MPSPKVATYDLKPEMSALEVTDKLVEAIAAGRYDAIVCNYANADMVGHTGDLDAAIRAVEALDVCIGRVVDGGARRGRRGADHRRPRQRGEDVRRGNRTAAHRAHAEPRAARLRRTPARRSRPGGTLRGHRADAARDAGPAASRPR